MVTPHAIHVYPGWSGICKDSTCLVISVLYRDSLPHSMHFQYLDSVKNILEDISSSIDSRINPETLNIMETIHHYSLFPKMCLQSMTRWNMLPQSISSFHIFTTIVTIISRMVLNVSTLYVSSNVIFNHRFFSTNWTSPKFTLTLVHHRQNLFLNHIRDF